MPTAAIRRAIRTRIAGSGPVAEFGEGTRSVDERQCAPAAASAPAADLDGFVIQISGMIAMKMTAEI